MQFLFEFVGAWQVGLIDDEDVGDFEHAGLHRLHIVSGAGNRHQNGHLREPGYLYFALPHAHGFDNDDVAAGGVEQRRQIGCRSRDPSRNSARGHGADEYPRVGVMLLHADAVAENRAAGNRDWMGRLQSHPRFCLLRAAAK